MTYYVDFSAANDGDGSAHTQAAAPGGVGAFNTLTGHIGADGDIFWVRRKPKDLAAVSITFNVGNVTYIGWPLSGDDYYASRPETPKADWDGDADSYAQFTVSAAGVVIISAAAIFHRFKGYGSATSGTRAPFTITNTAATPAVFRNCYAEGNHASVIWQLWNFNADGVRASLYNCVSKMTLNSANSVIYYLPSALSAHLYFYKCTIDYVATGNAHYGFWWNNSNSTVRTFNLTAIESHFYGRGALGGLYLNHTTTGWWYGVKHLIDCTFRCDAGMAIFIAGAIGHIIIDRGIVSGCAYCNLDGIGTAQSVPGMGRIHIKSYVQATASTYGLYSSRSIPVYIENAVFITGNTNADIYSEGGPLLIRYPEFKHATEVYVDTYWWRNVKVLDYNNNKGYMKQWLNKSIITSDATYRTGGTSYSMKAITLAAAAYIEEILGWFGEAGQETIFANCVAGSNTITVYGAHKLYGATPPTKDDFWMEGTYYTGASGGANDCFTTKDTAAGALDVDTSVWNGDSSLTVFKLTKTIVVGQDCIVPIRLFWKKHVLGAYVYIDPKPVVS